MTVDWEGLKLSYDWFQEFHGENTARLLAEAFPAILAQHEQDQAVVAEIKRLLSEGATIRATDANKFLESQPDGTIYGGLTVEYPKQQTHEQDQRVIEAAKRLADQVVVYLEGGDTVALDAALAEFDRVKP